MLNPAPAQGKIAASFSSPNHQASRPPASFPDARRWTSDLPGDLGNRRFSGPMNLACFVWRPGAGDTLHPEIKLRCSADHPVCKKRCGYNELVRHRTFDRNIYSIEISRDTRIRETIYESK